MKVTTSSLAICNLFLIFSIHLGARENTSGDVSEYCQHSIICLESTIGVSGNLGSSDNNVQIFILQTLPKPGLLNPTDCSELSDTLSTLSDPYVIEGDEVSQSVRDFSQRWLLADGHFEVEENLILIVEPTLIQQHRLGFIELPEDDWIENPTLEGRDLSEIEIVASCDIASEVEYYTTDLILKIDDAVAQWISPEAANNQFYYDNVASEDLKSLFGVDGLGYGDYAVAGLNLKQMPIAPGLEDWSYNEFGFHWQLQEIDVTDLAEAFIPEQIEKRLLFGWSDSCQNITLRIANHADFSDASISVANILESCSDHPLFKSDDAAEVPDNNSDEFLTYLQESDKLHHITLPLDAMGQLEPCDRMDPISLDGCSQKIVQSFNPKINAFFRGDKDLYVEIHFDGFTTKVYQMKYLTGEVIEYIVNDDVGVTDSQKAAYPDHLLPTL